MKLSMKKEKNILILLAAIKKIMIIFLGPFLTAYFIQNSIDNLSDLSLYYLLSFIILGIGSFLVSIIIKNRFCLGMFRIGVFINFIYILVIVLLKESIIDNLYLIALLHGISSSAYFVPFNKISVEKVSNSERTDFTILSRIVNLGISVIFPIILGTSITLTNFHYTTFIILILSFIQIILTFYIKPLIPSNKKKFSFKRVFNIIKKSKDAKLILLNEFLFGFHLSDGAFNVLITVIIIQSFKTNFNLGILTSVSTLLAIISTSLYKKKHSIKVDKSILFISGLIPAIMLLFMICIPNNFTVIIYVICFEMFVGILGISRDVKLYNISDSKIISSDEMIEFLSLREILLNCGRIISFMLVIITITLFNNDFLNILLFIFTIAILFSSIILSKINNYDSL